MSSNPKETIDSGRYEIILSLERVTTSLVMDPAFGSTGMAEATVQALTEMLSSYEKLVQAFHSSSNRSYALEDVRGPERESYQRTKHAISVLGQLHLPRAV